MNKLNPILIGLFSVLIVQLTACPRKKTEDNTQLNFTIGVSAPFTGILSEYGRVVRNGILLAKTRNETLFKNINFVYEDNKYSSLDSITAFQRLKLNYNPVLIYTWGEIPFNAISTLAKSSKTPLLVNSVDANPGLTNQFAIRVVNSSYTLVGTLVKYLRSKGYKKFGIIKVEDPYINACIEGFKNNLINDETLDIISTVQPDETTFEAHALKLKEHTFDVVGIYLNSGQISTFYRYLAALNIDIPTFGTDMFESKIEIESSGKIIEGAVYPNLKLPDWFSSEYLKIFNIDSQIAYAYNAYSVAMITGSVLSKLDKKPSAEELIQLFKRATASDTSLSFVYKETSNGDKFYEFPVVTKIIKNGKPYELN